tara:strand:+ start:673 stop:930 length:258 start_codon:yes stop_codon:yes gene_type:complete
MTIKKWFPTEEAIELLGLGRTNLLLLKDSDLIAGVHYVYVTGRKRGTIGWDVAAIQEWQIKKSQEIVNKSKKIANDVETYAEMGA